MAEMMAKIAHIQLNSKNGIENGNSGIDIIAVETKTTIAKTIDNNPKKIPYIAERIIINLGYDIGNSSLEQSELRYIIEEMKPKDRSSLYKQYIDKVESWIDGGGYKNLNKYLKNLDQFAYNEVILNQFKILGVYSVEGNDKEHEIKAQGLKYLGIISKTKIAKNTFINYIVCYPSFLIAGNE